MTAGYICAIGIAIIFMLYMDGDIGVMILSFLVLMPVLSVIMTALVRKKLTVRLILPESAGKYQQCSVLIELEKDTPLPLPFLRMQLVTDAHFDAINPDAEPLPEKPDADRFGFGYSRAYKRWRTLRKTQIVPDTLPLCLSMGTERKAQYRIRLTTRYCGNADIRLTSLTLSDYLAMFRFRLKGEPQEQLLITPEIPELKTNSNLFRNVSTAVAAADEETEAQPTFSAASMPGYEHRDYIAGDSLKRINWKLSSKRHHLMVRQDEPVSLARLTVVLDFRRTERQLPEQQRIAIEEQLIETTLGFLMLCAKYGYPCNLCYADESAQWSSIEIDDGSQLAVEAITLLRGGFRNTEALHTMPMMPPMTEPGVVTLYVSACAGPETVAALEQEPNAVYLLIPEQFADNCAVPKNGSLWLVTADRQITEANGGAV